MSMLPAAVAAVAPGVALLAYFYLKDKYITEPFALVAKMFMIGVLLVFPIMILQRGLFLWLSPPEWAMAFLLAGGVEEFFKWFALLYTIFRNKEFDEPYDGIVYAVSVSLGFATLENIFYAVSYQLGPADLILRALLPVSGHALFGVIMGYYLGLAKFEPADRNRQLLLALFVPVLWHGLFDYLMGLSATYWVWLIIPLMGALWLRGIRKVHLANLRSPYRALRRGDGSPPSSF
jgi:RsiW-degrading membrane proteinase PrsW (M82 family)